MIEFTPFVIQPQAKHFANQQNLYLLVQQLTHCYRTHQVQYSLLQEIGYLLWQTLHIDLPFIHAYQLHKKLALCIESDNPFIQGLPWESLYHPELGFLGKHPDFTLSRLLPGQSATQQQIKPPLRILLFTIPHPELFFEEEQCQLLEILSPWIAQGLIYLRIMDDGCFSTLFKQLHTQIWDIVFISGHAQFKNGQTLFKFGDKSFQLTDLFQTQQIACIVFAACETAYTDGHSYSLAAQLVNKNIPHAIGMQANLLDRAGTLFVKHFCDDLLQHGRLDKATQHARQAMTQLLKKNEIWQAATDLSIGQWCLPVLYSMMPTVPLFYNFKNPMPHKTRFYSLGQAIDLPKILIGRRNSLNTLKNKVSSCKVNKLWVYGVGGVGKTALVNQLVKQLQNYQILIYSENEKYLLHTELYQYFKLSKNSSWHNIIEKLEQKNCLLWLDNIPIDGYQGLFDILSKITLQKLIIIVTARQKNNKTNHFFEYVLKRPTYESFQKYVHYLSLPYEKVQIQLMYKLFNGNFKGVQLLQTLPYQLTGQAFTQQLLVVKRYLQSYQKNRHHQL